MDVLNPGTAPARRPTPSNRTWALRAADIGVVVSVWLYVMGLWMAFETFFGTPGLGVSFPYWPVLIVDATCGWVAMVLCAGRAWNHQPAILSWSTALIGLGVVVVGAEFSSGLYEILTLAAGALLLASSVASALEVPGPISEAPPLTWGGHPTFVSTTPTEAELRTVSEDLVYDESLLRPPAPRPPQLESPRRGTVGDDAHRHEKPEHTSHVGMKTDETGIEDQR